MEINFRPIQVSDNKGLAAIIRTSIELLHLPSEGTAHSDPTTDDLYTLFTTPNSYYFVAESNNSVLGGCGIYPSNGLPIGYCELVRFFLLPEARGKGLGLVLINKCIEKAIELGYKNMYLESFPDMTAAIHIYEKVGFNYLNHTLGNTGHFACNVWMEKQLI
jgi:putative acetyltransferase